MDTKDTGLVSAEAARAWLADEVGCSTPEMDLRVRYPSALSAVIALHARAEKAERERDEARGALQDALDAVAKWEDAAIQRKAERDRLARAVLDANVSTGGSLHEIDFCPFCGGCLGGPDAGRVDIKGHEPGCVRGELEAADAAREVTRG